MLLEAELRARLERLSLRPRRRVRGLWGGRHASVRRGESLDFADYREYAPGDDFRRIDHHLWARLGVVLVRLYEAEEEMPVQVVVDLSASMGFGAKAQTARRLAAAIAYLALAAGDRVRLVRVPGAARPLDIGPWARHASSWPRLERWLEAGVPGGTAELARAGRALVGEGALRGPLVVVSDLLTEDWRQALDLAGLKGGGLVLHVLDPMELEPDLTGDLSLVDSESGREVQLSVSTETLAAYTEAMDGFLAEVAGRARRGGMDYVLVPAVDDALERALISLAAVEAVRA